MFGMFVLLCDIQPFSFHLVFATIAGKVMFVLNLVQKLFQSLALRLANLIIRHLFLQHV